jgi:hypothetical protein
MKVSKRRGTACNKRPEQGNPITTLWLENINYNETNVRETKVEETDKLHQQKRAM